jgi:hypothetical protein
MQPTWLDAEHASAQALRAHTGTVEAAVTHVVLQVAFKSILLEAEVVCPLRHRGERESLMRAQRCNLLLDCTLH